MIEALLFTAFYGTPTFAAALIANSVIKRSYRPTSEDEVNEVVHNGSSD